MGPDDARAAKAEAERKLREAQARAPEVTRVSRSLQDLADRNGFGAMLTAAMSRKGAS